MTTPNNQDDELDKILSEAIEDAVRNGMRYGTKQEREKIPISPFSIDKPVVELRSAILAWHNKQLSEVDRAYGGCHNCYGKGHETKQKFVTGGGKKWKTSPVKYCDCDRGVQLEQLLHREKLKARIDELNSLNEWIWANRDKNAPSIHYNVRDERLVALQSELNKENV